MEKTLSATKSNYTMMRIAITGPESTGKTTLAQELAKHYNCSWVPEYARYYLEKSTGLYVQKDLDIIAKGQLDAWDQLKTEPLCFYDTEMLVMKVWSEFKYKQLSSYLSNALANQQIDLFLLCKPDIEWEEDELREHPEERERLFEIYLSELEKLAIPFKIIKGQYAERTASAIQFVNEFLKSNEKA